MLDTNICIYLINKKSADLARKIISIASDMIYISTITQSELEFGVAKSQDKLKNSQALSKFLSIMNIIAYDSYAAETYGVIRAALEQTGNLIGHMDMLIAAHAKSKGFTIITNNTREFARVDGLIIEDWTLSK
jgi:tRNA(fMet)-specific endonuclease VapC